MIEISTCLPFVGAQIDLSSLWEPVRVPGRRVPRAGRPRGPWHVSIPRSVGLQDPGSGRGTGAACSSRWSQSAADVGRRVAVEVGLFRPVVLADGVGLDEQVVVESGSVSNESLKLRSADVVSPHSGRTCWRQALAIDASSERARRVLRPGRRVELRWAGRRGDRAIGRELRVHALGQHARGRHETSTCAPGCRRCRDRSARTAP